MQDSWDSTGARKQVSDARTAAASAALIGQEARDIFAGISSMLQSLGHLRFVGPDWPTDSDSDSRLWWDLYVGWWKGPVSITFNHEYNLSWSNQIVWPDMRFYPGTHRLLVCHVPRRLTLRSKMNQADFMTLKVLVQINASICYQISMVPIWFQCRRGKHRKTLEISDPFETDSSTTWPPPPVKLMHLLWGSQSLKAGCQFCNTCTHQSQTLASPAVSFTGVLAEEQEANCRRP